MGGTPLGSRLPAAAFGVAGVLVVFLLGMELWGSVGWATLAAFLLATDGLHVVHSRIAMLDVFLTTFVTAGAYSWFGTCGACEASGRRREAAAG